MVLTRISELPHLLGCELESSWLIITVHLEHIPFYVNIMLEQLYITIVKIFLFLIYISLFFSSFFLAPALRQVLSQHLSPQGTRVA